jgi:hypothetical protein
MKRSVLSTTTAIIAGLAVLAFSVALRVAAIVTEEVGIGDETNARGGSTASVSPGTTGGTDGGAFGGHAPGDRALSGVPGSSVPGSGVSDSGARDTPRGAPVTSPGRRGRSSDYRLVPEGCRSRRALVDHMEQRRRHGSPYPQLAGRRRDRCQLRPYPDAGRRLDGGGDDRCDRDGADDCRREGDDDGKRRPACPSSGAEFSRRTPGRGGYRRHEPLLRRGASGLAPEHRRRGVGVRPDRRRPLLLASPR